MSAAAIGLLGQLTNAEGDLSGKVQIVAVIVTLLLLGLVVELVRRRRLIERYALLWIIAAIAMVVLAVWRGGLSAIGKVIGVADPVNAIFLVAFAVVFALLLHFSVAISRLSEETKILAQVVSRLDAELRELRGRGAAGNGGPEPAESAGSREHLGEQPTAEQRPAAKPQRPEG
jgi:hypothetical protein